jgi:hypothetical protein
MQRLNSVIRLTINNVAKILIFIKKPYTDWTTCSDFSEFNLVHFYCAVFIAYSDTSEFHRYYPPAGGNKQNSLQSILFVQLVLFIFDADRIPWCLRFPTTNGPFLCLRLFQ